MFQDTFTVKMKVCLLDIFFSLKENSLLKTDILQKRSIYFYNYLTFKMIKNIY